MHTTTLVMEDLNTNYNLCVYLLIWQGIEEI